MNLVPASVDFGLGTAILTLGLLPVLRHRLRPTAAAGGIAMCIALCVLAPLLPLGASSDLRWGLALAALAALVGLFVERGRPARRTMLGLELALGAAAASCGLGLGGLPWFAALPLSALLLGACSRTLHELDSVPGLAVAAAAVAAALLAVGAHVAALVAWRDVNAALCGALVGLFLFGLATGEPRARLASSGAMACGLLLGISAIRLAPAPSFAGPALGPWVIVALLALEACIWTRRWNDARRCTESPASTAAAAPAPAAHPGRCFLRLACAAAGWLALHLLEVGS